MNRAVLGLCLVVLLGPGQVQQGAFVKRKAGDRRDTLAMPALRLPPDAHRDVSGNWFAGVTGACTDGLTAGGAKLWRRRFLPFPASDETGREIHHLMLDPGQRRHGLQIED